MFDFRYQKATSVVEAAEMAAAAGDNGKLMAGGMTLIPTMKQRLAQPSSVIDLAGIKELVGISVEDGALVIGAMTPHAVVAASKDVQAKIPALASLAGNIGDRQVRHRGTIGGSVANNDPAADYPAAVLALNATIITNQRNIAADDYFKGMFDTALELNEIIIGFSFPIPDRAGYMKFPNPASRYAMVGVFVAQTGDQVRVGVTGASKGGVFRARNIEEALSKDFSPNAIEGLEFKASEMNSDIHASAEYRAHLIGVMASRAVHNALE